MKKIYCILALLCCAFLSCCGIENGESRKDTDRTDTGVSQEAVTEYRDIRSESKEVFSMEGIMGSMVGLQFFQGERAMIWAVRKDGLADIYLYREDGRRELLLEGMPEDYSFARWFIDEEGGFYRCNNIGESLVKMDAEGKELYRVPLEAIGTNRIEELCQLADGRILLTYSEKDSSDPYVLSEMDPDTGEISRVGTVRLDDSSAHVAAGEEGMLYLDASGVSEINLENGREERKLSFVGTSYRLLEDVQWDSIESFRMLEDGSVELLRYKRDQESWEKTFVSEVLQAKTEATQRDVLTMRCWNITGMGDFGGTKSWLKNQMERFNQQNSRYMVVLDECPEGAEREDFARQTSIEMTAGGGPDLLYGNVLGDYAWGAIRKGVLADLASYIEASGIRDEDYFPDAFDCWREGEGIYGVCLDANVRGWRIRKGVLDGDSVPDGNALADALLARTEDAVLSAGYDSGEVLRWLLEGSGDFWGTLDWETGRCSFTGASFARILETAKRYGNNGLAEKPEIIEPRAYGIEGIDTAADRAAEGMEAAGVPFDDGFHSVMVYTADRIMAVNANSAHTEGAWEFISFLLGEEAQLAFQRPDSSGYGTPVHKGAFEECIKAAIAFFSEVSQKGSVKTLPGYEVIDVSGKTIRKYPRDIENISDERVEEFRAMLEDARPLPIRTAPLLDIIAEEAEYYFDGTKSIEEVTAVIQNRVQLYMDETR